jgi:outer membrane protein assembly factor BamB
LKRISIFLIFILLLSLFSCTNLTPKISKETVSNPINSNENIISKETVLPQTNIDENIQPDSNYSIKADLLYDLSSEVSEIIDSKIDNGFLYLLATIKNEYRTLSSWSHIHKIDINNGKRVRRSNIIYKGFGIAGISDNTLYLSISHDIVPFNKNDFNRINFFISVDPRIIYESNSKIYLDSSEQSEITCISKKDNKLIWKYPIEVSNNSMDYLPYVYEINNKVILFALNHSDENKTLNLILLDSETGKELSRNYLFSLIKDDPKIYISYKDTNFYIINEAQDSIEFRAYNIAPDGTFNSLWGKRFKGNVLPRNKEGLKYISFGFQFSNEIIVDDKNVYLPIYERKNKSADQDSEPTEKSIYALDIKTGKLIWVYKFPDKGNFIEFLKQSRQKIDENNLCFSTFGYDQNHNEIYLIYSINKANGKLTWSSRLDGDILDINRLYGDKIWLVERTEIDSSSESYTLILLDANSGKLLNKYEPEKTNFHTFGTNINFIPYSDTEAIYVLEDGRIFRITLSEKK